MPSKFHFMHESAARNNPTLKRKDVRETCGLTEHRWEILKTQDSFSVVTPVFNYSTLNSFYGVLD